MHQSILCGWWKNSKTLSFHVFRTVINHRHSCLENADITSSSKHFSRMLWPRRWPRSIISSLVFSNPWGDPWDVGNPVLRLALSDAFEYIPLKGKTLQFALDTFQSFMQSHIVWFFKDGVPRIPVGFGPIHTSLYNFKGCRDFSGFNLSMPCFTEAVHS